MSPITTTTTFKKSGLPKPFPIKIANGKIAFRAVKVILEKDETGLLRKRIINTTRKTPEEAIWSLMERLNQIENGTSQFIPKPKKVVSETIDEFLQSYLKELSTGEGAIRPATTRNYQNNIKAILRPEYELTGTMLVDVDTEAIRTWRIKLTEIPTKRTGKPIGPKFTKSLNTFLNGALASAVSEGKISTNPMSVKTTEDKRRAKLVSKQEIQRKTEREEQEQIKERIFWFPQTLYHYLLKQHRKEQSDWTSTRLCYVVSSYFSFRPSEVRGLTLEKINLTRGMESITISQTLIDSKIEQGTKTPSGTRTLPLVEPLLSIVSEQVSRRKASGAKPTDLLLTSIGGGVFRQQNQNEDYRELLDELGLDYIRLYSNRHISTTILQKLKYNLQIISYINGWKQPETMLEVYGHFGFDDEIKEALTELGKFISSEPQQQG